MDTLKNYMEQREKNELLKHVTTPKCPKALWSRIGRTWPIRRCKVLSGALNTIVSSMEHSC